MQRELKALRQRNKELEGELRRTTSALQKTRQLNQMQSAYGQGKREQAWGGEGAPAMATRLPAGAVDAEAFAQARREWEAELNRVSAVHHQKLVSISRMHASEIASLRGEGRSLEEAAAAREAAAKEERVELLRRQSVRRMLNRDLSWGWQCWLDLWEAKTYAMKRLRECAQRLKSPEMAEAYGVWVTVWEATVRRRELAAAESRAKGALEGAETLQEEVERLRLALERAEDEKEKALERQLTELTGSAEERMALQAEREKEERVELLRRQMMRRMMNAGLTVATHDGLQPLAPRSAPCSLQLLLLRSAAPCLKRARCLD